MEVFVCDPVVDDEPVFLPVVVVAFVLAVELPAVVVVDVSVLFAQETQNAAAATNVVTDRSDFFIGL